METLPAANTVIDLFINCLKYESEVIALGFVDERQMFEDVVKKEMLFEHSQKKTNDLLDSLENNVNKCEMPIELVHLF